jgi:hypothetical protein
MSGYALDMNAMRVDQCPRNSFKLGERARQMSRLQGKAVPQAEMAERWIPDTASEHSLAIGQRIVFNRTQEIWQFTELLESMLVRRRW